MVLPLRFDALHSEVTSRSVILALAIVGGIRVWSAVPKLAFCRCMGPCLFYDLCRITCDLDAGIMIRRGNPRFAAGGAVLSVCRRLQPTQRGSPGANASEVGGSNPAQIRRSATFSMRWLSPLRSMSRARWRVGRIFSKRFLALIVRQI